MKNKIDISVLMATRNPNPTYFRECLESIKNQTYKDFELVIIDDASDSVNIQFFLGDYDFPIQIIRNNDQLGLAKSLNKGLKISRGNYIARIDDDDLMMPQRLERQIEFAKKHFGFIHSRAEIIDENGNVLRESEHVDNIKKKLKRRNCLIHSSMFVDKSILNEMNGYNSNYVFVQDYELYMRAIDKYNFYLVDDLLVKYRLIKGHNSYEKNALSRAYSFVAGAEYFCKHPTIKNKILFWGRAVIILRRIYDYTFRND